MSSSIEITQEVRATVTNVIELPAFFNGEFNSYVAIVREDLAITVFHANTSLCSIQTCKPSSLYTNIGSLEPLDREVFLSAYKKCMDLFTEISNSDLNIQPC